MAYPPASRPATKLVTTPATCQTCSMEWLTATLQTSHRRTLQTPCKHPRTAFEAAAVAHRGSQHKGNCTQRARLNRLHSRRGCCATERALAGGCTIQIQAHTDGTHMLWRQAAMHKRCCHSPPPTWAVLPVLPSGVAPSRQAVGEDGRKLASQRSRQLHDKAKPEALRQLCRKHHPKLPAQLSSGL